MWGGGGGEAGCDTQLVVRNFELVAFGKCFFCTVIYNLVSCDSCTYCLIAAVFRCVVLVKCLAVGGDFKRRCDVRYALKGFCCLLESGVVICARNSCLCGDRCTRFVSNTYFRKELTEPSIKYSFNN